MGGSGSGRRGQGGALTTEDMSSVDIRWLHRKCNIKILGTRTVTWSRCGRTTGSISITMTADGVIFSYTVTPNSGEPVRIERLVTVEWTETQFGGHRPWFSCPRCGRRTAIVFAGRSVACRKCLGIRHQSQNECASDRAIRRIDFLRDKLKWEPGFLNGTQWRPKGMHRKTYQRLLWEYTETSRYVNLSIALRFGFAAKALGDCIPYEDR